VSKVETNENPIGWSKTEFSNLVVVNYGKALSSANRSSTGRVPVVGSSGIVGWHDEPLVEGPCLVVGRKGAAGAVHLVQQSCWPIDTAYYIQPPVGIRLEYLNYLLGLLQLSQLDKSTAIPSLSRDDLYRVEIPLAPVGEQTRIVEKLEELLSDLDAGVTELKAAQKKLGQYRQSLLKAAVEGPLTAEWRKQQQAPLSPRGRGAGGEGANTPKTDTWFRDRARELRKAQTPAEHDLWQQLRAKRFSGFKFRRQQVIGNYIVDFVCFDQKLVIELDGSQHAEAKERDESRDRWLSEQGFRVLRFWNNEWMAQAESVLETIWSALHKQPPLPNPSPTRGEGLDAPFSLDGLGGEGETGAQLL
jgi:very-short-patch-repair endonuclease